MKVRSKPKCQQGLEFASTIETVTIWKHQYYQIIWKITHCQLLLLYKKYPEDFPNNPVSKGIFSLKPFYIRNASKKNMEVCLCELHLHFLSGQQKHFFNGEKKRRRRNTSNYIPSSPFNIDGWLSKWTSYKYCILWICTQKLLLKNWGDMKDIGSIMVPFNEFQSQICWNAKEEVIKNKKGKEINLSQ